jgi:hypothetical protein
LEVQKDPRFFTQKGIFTKKLNKDHWNLIYKTLPQTSILHLLYRLRIKANYEDIETFIHAEIDFKKFHGHIGALISYLNYIHESYVLKVIGEDAYEKILHGFAKHLNQETAVSRYRLMKENWLT